MNIFSKPGPTEFWFDKKQDESKSLTTEIVKLKLILSPISSGL